VSDNKAKKLTDHWKKLSTMSHDDVYLVDSSLVIQFANGKDQHWFEWATEHLKRGHKFYVLPTTILDLSRTRLPEGFEEIVLRRNKEISEETLEDALKELFSAIPSHPANQLKFKYALYALLEAGHSYSWCTNVPPKVRSQKNGIFLTARKNFVQRFLRDPKKRAAIERIIRLQEGLDRLLPVRCILGDSYQNYTFPPPKKEE